MSQAVEQPIELDTARNQLQLELDDLASRVDCTADELPAGIGELRYQEIQFIKNYLSCGIGQKAAELAGYAPSSARVVASQLLTKPTIRRVLNEAVSRTSASVPRLLERVWQRAQIAHDNYLKAVENGFPKTIVLWQQIANKEDALIAQILGKTNINLNVNGEVNHNHLHMSPSDLTAIADARRTHYVTARN